MKAGSLSGTRRRVGSPSTASEVATTVSRWLSMVKVTAPTMAPHREPTPPSTTMISAWMVKSAEEIESRVVDEVKDHPLFLVPLAIRRKLLEDIFEASEAVNAQVSMQDLKGLLA